MFAKLKDWRSTATRYDRCAHNFFSAICIAGTVIFYLKEWVLNLAVAAGEEVTLLRTSAIQGPLMGFDRAYEKGSLQHANSSTRPR